MAHEPKKLLDQLGPAPQLGSLRALLATTYNLTASFVDGELLPQVLGAKARLRANRRERIALERQLAELDAAVILMDGRPFEARPRSLRVELHASMQPSIQHSKVTVLVYDNGVRLTVGSANLSTFGYRKNREIAAILTASPGHGTHKALIQDALRLMPTVLAGWWTPSADTVLALAKESLEQVPDHPEEDQTRFVWSGPGQAPLAKQLRAAWPGGTIHRITVVSPFWSEDGRPLPELLSALEGVIDENTQIRLLSEQHALPDGTDVPLVPAGLLSLDVDQDATVQCVAHLATTKETGRKDAVLTRRLHAKMVLLEGETDLLYAGSANFTAPAWGLLPHVNAEAGLLVRGHGLAALVPATVGAPVPLGQREPANHGGRDPNEAATPSWPSFLRGVELTTTNGEFRLSCRVDQSRVEGDWSVQDLLGPGVHSAVVDDATDLLFEGEVTVLWWGGKRRFPMNVDQALRNKLPLTADGQPPGEAELLAYYLGRIAYEDTHPDPRDRVKSEGDERDGNPHGVDTSKIQSYQVREFVEALPGLFQDLERTVGIPASYRMALTGPVSPVALAKAILQEHRNGTRSDVAAFFELEELREHVFRARALRAPKRHRAYWEASIDAALAEIDTAIRSLGRPPSAIRRLQKALRVP